MTDTTSIVKMTPAQVAQEGARELYRRSLREENPLTGTELGERFERSESWGLARIREVREEAQSNPRLEGEVPLQGLPPMATPPSLPAEPQERVAETAAPQSEPVAPQPVSAETAEMILEPRERVAETAAPVKRENPQRRGASAVSWLAFGLGIVVSILANIGHIWFVSKPEDGAMVSAMVFAGFWPIGLAIAVEVLSRVTWPKGLKWAGIIGTAFVGVVALIMSYRHMNGLLLHFGESDLSAALGPLGVDGLLIVGGFAILAIGETKRQARK